MSRRIRLAQPVTASHPSEVVTTGTRPEWVRAWDEALKAAGGDPLRLTRNRDGSVTVHNKPRRRPE